MGLPPESYDPNALKDIQDAVETAKAVINSNLDPLEDYGSFGDLAGQAKEVLEQRQAGGIKVTIHPPTNSSESILPPKMVFTPKSDEVLKNISSAAKKLGEVSIEQCVDGRDINTDYINKLTNTEYITIFNNYEKK